MSRVRFRLDATETFVRWLEAKCGPEVVEGITAVLDAERGDVGAAIEDQLLNARHYHAETRLRDDSVLTVETVRSIVQRAARLPSRFDPPTKGE